MESPALSMHGGLCSLCFVLHSTTVLLCRSLAEEAKAAAAYDKAVAAKSKVTSPVHLPSRDCCGIRNASVFAWS